MKPDRSGAGAPTLDKNTAATGSPPFFIVGSPRSGTTLLQALLDAHPDIAIPPESHIYARFAKLFPLYGDLRAPACRRRWVRDLVNDVWIWRWNLPLEATDIERLIAQPTRPAIIDELFRIYAAREGATRWGDKTPGHAHALPLIRQDFPGAKVIHMIRDGRDVAESLRRMPWGASSMVGLAEEWRRDVLACRAFFGGKNHPDLLEVRYEQLVNDPEGQLQRVFAFLGVSFRDTTRSYAESSLTHAYLNRDRVHASLEGGIKKSRVGVYRKTFTAAEIEIFESIAGDALQAHGYALHHASPRLPTTAQRIQAKGRDRVWKWYGKLTDQNLRQNEIQARLRSAALRAQQVRVAFLSLTAMH